MNLQAYFHILSSFFTSANLKAYLLYMINNIFFRPTEMFLNPMEVQQIISLSATKIDANHMVIVYKKTSTNKVERRVVKGPAVFIPDADEW